MPVPLWLIAGPGGARQAVWLDQQLAARPADETWAVLAGDAESAPAAAPGLHVEMLGGCPCCSGAATLRVALVRLLRQVRPQRLFVLPRGGVHADPAAPLARDPWLAPALAVTRFTLLPPEWARHLPEAALRDRLRFADRVVLLEAAADAIQRIAALDGPVPETASGGSDDRPAPSLSCRN